MNVFREYAKYYDLFYQDKDYDVEVDYVDKLIRKYRDDANSIYGPKPPTTPRLRCPGWRRLILDLGCGTGKHADFFAQKGYCVHGVDISKEMIALAKKNFSKSDKLVFSCGDVRTIDLNKKFDIVLSLFHVFSYQITNQDLNEAFSTAVKHLKDNGVFIFDCWYGPAVLKNKPLKKIKKINNKEVELTRVAQPVVYPNDNIVDVNYNINFFNKSSGKKGSIEETHKMRYLFKPEIEQFLTESGLALLNYEEWLTGKEPTSESWSVCFICKKK